MNQAAKGLSKERPFPGLRPFEAEDWEFFFGRTDQTAALYRLIDRNRFVAVVGSSGSGKSSLTRAGLLRILEEDNGEGRTTPWVPCAMHPGNAPIRILAQKLAGLVPGHNPGDTKRDRIEHHLTTSTFGFEEALSEAGIDENARFVLVIDQFEELFRYADYSDQQQIHDRLNNVRAHDEASQFVELLLEARRSRRRDIRILITMRSDFIGECAQFEGLAEAVSATQFLVPGLTRDQLEEIITEPIKKAGGTINAVLVEQLLNDASGELDELPVLQHCLSQLWERAAGPSTGGAPDLRDTAGGTAAKPVPREITAEHYKQVGKVSGALSQHANRILEELPEKSVAAVFRALSEIKDGRRIRRALAYLDLREETGLPDDELLRIINRFRADDCSFLLTSPRRISEITDETRIDVCHEALLRRWDKCGGAAKVRAGEEVEQKESFIGWLEQERWDGQQYQFLHSIANRHRNSAAVEDIKFHRDWWTKRKPTERWTERYGGGYAAVDNMIRAGWTRHRRVRTIAGATASAVLVALALSGYGLYTKNREAKLNGKLAEESLDLGKKVLNNVLDSVNDGRMQLTAALGIERPMGDFIDKKLRPARADGKPGQEIEHSPKIIELESQLHYTAADILFDAGKDAEALSRAKQAKDSASTLVQRNNANPMWQDLLRESTQRVGDTLSRTRDFAGALAQFREAQALIRPRIEQPLGDEKLSELAYYQSYYFSRAGDMLLKLTNSQAPANAREALSEYRKALEIAETYAAKYPEDARLRAAVPRYTAKIAAALAALPEPDIDGSLKKYDEALRLQEPLAGKPEAGAPIRSNLALSYAGKAAVLSKLAQWAPAVALFQKAIDIHQHLLDRDNSNASWLIYLADEQHGLAEAYLRPDSFSMSATPDPASQLQLLKDASAALHSELETRDRLMKIDPENRNLIEDRVKVQKQLDELKTRIVSRN